MDQQFSLSWNNFHGNLSKGFAGLLGKGEFVDVTIAVEGHLLQAHKVILSICSPYFKKMFQLNPCQHPIVVLRDIGHKAMKDLLQFMYHGEVSVKQEELTTFIGTAEVLQIKGLTNRENNEYEQCNDTHNAESKSISAESSDLILNDRLSQTDGYELLKQKDLLDKLERLNSLKRKSEEHLHRKYFDAQTIEKRPKLKQSHNGCKTQSKHITDYTNDANDETSISPINLQVQQQDFDKTTNSILEQAVKKECEEGIITNSAACNTLQDYDDGCDNIVTPTDNYQSPQDSALSLVVNGSGEGQLPTRYKYIYSRKGHKQLVHMNFVYTKHSTTHGKTSWRCVQYFSLNRCPATIETVDSMIYAVNHQHNHEDCFEKLSKNNIYEMNETVPT